MSVRKPNKGPFGAGAIAALARPKQIPAATSAIKEIDKSEVTLNRDKFLGKGGFGCVHAGTWNGKKVAVKTLNFPQNPAQEIRKFKSEAALAFSLNHGNIVKVFGMMTGSDGEMALIMELADGGPLTAKKMKELMLTSGDKEKARKLSLGLISGLEYLHQNHVVHRDLKPDNILCFGHQPTPKISDFGISKVISHTKAYMETAIGTPTYMAPEVLNSAYPVRYNKTVDVYSLSLILYQIFTGGQDPFPGCNTFGQLIQAKMEGRKPAFTPGFPPGLKPLLDRGYSKEPEKRPTLTELRLALMWKCKSGPKVAEPLSKIETKPPPLAQPKIQKPSPAPKKLLPAGHQDAPTRAIAMAPAKNIQAVKPMPRPTPSPAKPTGGKVVHIHQYERKVEVVTRHQQINNGKKGPLVEDRWAMEAKQRFMNQLPTIVREEVIANAQQQAAGANKAINRSESVPAAPQAAKKEEAPKKKRFSFFRRKKEN